MPLTLDHTLPLSDSETSFYPNRAQIWFALQLRIHDPRRFLPGLSSCTISEENGVTTRELDFSGNKVLDTVSIDENEGWIRFEVQRTASHAGGSLTIAVEKDTQGSSVQPAFNLRFTYKTSLAEGVNEEEQSLVPISDYVKAAYMASDGDTVRIIREILLAELNAART